MPPVVNRLPVPPIDDVPAEHRDLVQRLAREYGKRPGPWEPMLSHPTLAERTFALSDKLRLDGLLPRAVSELVILATAREVQAPFEWFAHAPQAEAQGTSSTAIAAVRDGGPTTALPEREAVAVETVRALHRRHTLTDAEYARLAAAFTPAERVELVVLCGYYTQLGFVLNAFAIDPPAEAAVPFARPGA